MAHLAALEVRVWAGLCSLHFRGILLGLGLALCGDRGKALLLQLFCVGDCIGNLLLVVDLSEDGQLLLDRDATRLLVVVQFQVAENVAEKVAQGLVLARSLE